METLTQSFKHSYLFKLGTTSFIYPDLYSENVRQLAPFLDEIELLFFESREPQSLPDAFEISQLAELQQKWDVSYNIHMPTDVNLGSSDPAERALAADTYQHVFNLVKPLNPSTLTVHLPHDPTAEGDDALWLAQASQGLTRLLDTHMDSRLISIETLDYPLDIIRPLIESFDLSVCLDVGHVILQGREPIDVFNAFKDRISIIHLHGVDQGQDHQSLDRMAPEAFLKVRAILEEFTGTVSLEVFSFDKLKRSLDFFKEML